MANKVLLKKSSVAAKVPLVTDLDYGELALNYTDEKLYFKNASNAIKSFNAGTYTLPAATSTTLGGIELFSDTVQSTAANSVTTTASRTYGVQVNSAGQAVVNVPWSDTNTTYTGSKGITLSGTDFRITGNEIPGSIDLNTYRTTGFYAQNANADAASGTNYPTANAGILQVINDDYGNGLHTTQLYSQYNSTNYYHRTYYNGTWTAWRNLAQDTTYTVNDGTLTLNVSGTGLSGSQTFSANQSSNATFTVTSNATSANTASTIVARDGSGNFTAGTITAALTGSASNNVLKTGDTMTGDLTFTGASSSIHLNEVGQEITFGETAGTVAYIRHITGGQLQIGSDDQIAFYETDSNVASVSISTNNNTVTATGGFIGNASTATTLQTARTINGTSFNGSANITTSNWGTARTLTIGSTGKSVDGSANVSWTLAEIGAQASGNYVTTDTTQTISGAKTFSTAITHNTTSTRDKYRLWSDSNYVIGMQSNITFGAINNDYAMTFQMNNAAARGFWWGHAGHTTAQGAMSLSTSGLLTVASGVRIGFGESDTTVPSANTVEISGALLATSKSFLIKHPTKTGKKLRHGSLEGPEHGVYVRGKLKGNVIELPEYWTKLVDQDSITVQLTPIGKHQKLYVEAIENNKVYIANDKLLSKEINCFYFVQAERVDIDKMEVEIE